MIYGNAVGGAGRLGKTVVIQDENGHEFVGVVTDSEVVFDATPNDIRIGKVAATGDGVTVGEKVIPSYQTMEGVQLIPAEREFKITSLSDNDMYNFTKLQALACLYNTNTANSVETVAVGINRNVYPVSSTTAVSEITIDHENKAICFGVMNTYEKPCVIRYFTYKEEY